MDKNENTQGHNRISNHSDFTSVLNLLNDLRSNERVTALLKLREREKNSTIEILGEILKHSDPSQKILAIEALMNIDARQTLGLVLPFLDAPDKEIRWTICHWLCEDGDSRAIDPLIKALKGDTDVNVRTQAAIALGASRDARVKEALIWAKEHDFEVDFHGHSVSWAATIALRNLTADL